uniref:Uncharacterized protein n=1 Tax=Plectus sambesii TaxID=2011161 RepID=A0A914WJK4_9BILA
MAKRENTATVEDESFDHEPFAEFYVFPREDCPVCGSFRKIENAPRGADGRRQASVIDTAALDMMIGGVPPNLDIPTSVQE